MISNRHAEALPRPAKPRGGLDDQQRSALVRLRGVKQESQFVIRLQQQAIAAATPRALANFRAERRYHECRPGLLPCYRVNFRRSGTRPVMMPQAYVKPYVKK
jgi:hypothetical protein